MEITLLGLGITLVAPVLRSVAGWIENAFEDGKISKFELRHLGSTVLRVGMLALAGYVGLESLGVQASASAGSAAGILIDYLTRAFTKPVEKVE